MRKAKRVLAAVLGVTLAAGMGILTGCSEKKEKVLIYSSAEDYRIEDLRNRLEEEFPEYDCVVEYKETGSIAAKLMAEGKDTDCDIVYDLEYGYLSQLEREGTLTDLSEYDFSVYTEDTVVSNYYIPTLRNGGVVIVNPAVLEEKNLPVPESYDDLLKPEYKGMISMPNPKSSGTGYMFLRALTNEMGEDEAFAYFDSLTENILSYTSSGSGPVNALKNKEAAIGLGMTAQTVQTINEGTELEMHYFGEGSPYSLYGQAIINGKGERESVKKVFDFLINTYGKETNEKFFPEKIFKEFSFEIKNYPTDIHYADMSNDTPEEKSRLLDKWNH